MTKYTPFPKPCYICPCGGKYRLKTSTINIHKKTKRHLKYEEANKIFIEKEIFIEKKEL